MAGEQETELAFQIADRYISIQETLNDIVEDLKENPVDNGARGNICDSDELTLIDYEELMEKVEAANHIEPGKAVDDYKAKTKAMFHDIDGMTVEDIERTVELEVQSRLIEYSMKAEIVDIAVTGSHCRGLEHGGSDLDVTVELITEEREEYLEGMREASNKGNEESRRKNEKLFCV